MTSAAAWSVPPQGRGPEPLLPETERALLHRLAVEQARARVPSLVAGLVRDGHLLWHGVRGDVDGLPPGPRTQYRVGSLTKTFVAVLVMQLRDEGLLALDEPLGRHLPEAASPGVAELTVASLLSHTSGLTAEPPGPWWERSPGTGWPELDARLAGAPPVRARQDAAFHYSNLGFALLGRLVERLRGAPWEEVLRERICAPLGLRDTTVTARPPHAHGLAVHPWADVTLPEPADNDTAAMAPAGQLWSTVPDLARWIAFLDGDTGGVLAPATLAEMRAPVSAVDGDGDGWGLGLALARVDGARLVGHSGSMPGFVAGLWLDVAERTGVVFLADATSGVNRLLATDLLRIVRERQPRVPDVWSPLPSGTVPPALLEITGPWYWGPAPHVLRLRTGAWDGAAWPDPAPAGGGLVLELSPLGAGGRESRFRPVGGAVAGEGDTEWVGLDGYHAGERLRVVRAGDGSVTHLEVNTFVYTRRPYDPAAPLPGGVRPWRL
ncbi:serine hydrolase domain-containing protein [Allostreptomyces psammosilenae]|uniref:CubicO group peptidase (Beta-lactamase class C family) n=1 Tax=Allostreptomyces psammosilenae TaxID=1892865 RepID=A0A852ZT46_9ACTN|nr:serine hydrolase domain-containing protein [Allostreptomyces psammosilenae]NYI04440.1 CubicO group peptidase (beta-lactamase class C family) [Allostreptomyces psammosilenae]